MNQDAQKIIARTNLSLPLEKYLTQAALFYNVGFINNFNLIEQGYEDANIKIDATKGQFVVKIFNKERTISRINSFIKTLTEFKKLGIPSTDLVRSSKGYLFIHGNVYAYLTRFFHGKSLLDQKVTLEDMKLLTQYLAKINTLYYPVAYGYDSWGIANLLPEYNKKKFVLTEDLNQIEQIVESYKKIDFNKCSKSVIHGDMQKQHVLKNDNGQLCIIDLGCLNLDYTVYDLAIYIAEFCIEYEDKKNFEKIYDLILKIYTKIKPLTKYELTTIPVLIQAHYLICYITAIYLMKTQNDISQETKWWHNLGKKGIELSSKWF